MKLRILLSLTILCILGIPYIFPSNIYAGTVTPSIYEKTITAGSKTTGNVTFKNEGSDIITLSPSVSAYDAKTLQLITSEQTLFILMDRETYTVQPQGILTLNYEIKPPTNLSPGTYFNLIIFNKTVNPGFINQKNPLDTVETLSQLVTIHIVEQQETLPLQIKTDFAQITLEIIDPGIPFLKPLVVKYIYQNNTSYVLQPLGEIQVFDSKSSYSPGYQQINTANKKVYPRDKIEETVTIKKWHISDILFGRKIVGRFYNGIDQNSIVKEISQNSNYTFMAILLVVVLMIIILMKSIQSDRKKNAS